ncbi:MAG: hypothetical protein C5B57_07610 [Blastocatellia bacterium]|nr:MAG: hypothetical protein C5B57_07610 [Blastocatellia bacterium]
MNWLERACREFQAKAEDGTANTAERSLSALSAVPNPRLSENQGRLLSPTPPTGEAVEERAAIIIQIPHSFDSIATSRGACSSIKADDSRLFSMFEATGITGLSSSKMLRIPHFLQSISALVATAVVRTG